MNKFNRLKWQCRRGTLELDILLENYLKSGFLSAREQEKAAFVKLLRLEDSELLPYLMGERTPGAEDLAQVVAKIRLLRPTQF